MNRKQRRAGGGQGVSVAAASPAAQQAFMAGVQHHMAGRLAEAEALYRQALAGDPRHADSLHMLGMVAYQVERSDVALDLIGQAIAIQGRNSAYHADLCAVLQDLGRLDDAVASGRRATTLKPDSPKAHKNLGYALQALGQGEQAAASLRASVRLKADPAVHYNLGVLLQDLGQPEAAADAYSQALALTPDFPEAMNNLGNALRAVSRPMDALTWYRKAVALRPDLAAAHNNLAAILSEQRDFAAAADSYRKVVALTPDAAEAHHNLGASLRVLGDLDGAIDSFRRAVTLNPGLVECLTALAATQHHALRFVEAAKTYRQAIAASPDLGALYNGLGNVLADLGEVDAAIAAFQRAVALEPIDLGARSNLLMTLHYSPDGSDAQILTEARQFADQVEVGPAPAFPSTREPDRRLRIGYVSADLRTHPVGFFLAGVLRAHDRQQVEVTCYSNTAFADKITQRLQADSDRWRVIAGLPDAEAAALIRQDGIDLLVDLSGHTDGNRLPLFAARCAPVQASWLGYFGTTGLSAIDHVIADAVVIAPGEETGYSESVLRLPGGYLTYSPPEQSPSVGPFPALTQGFVTFGCLNNRTKVGPEVIATWAEILGRVEDSRLLLKTRTFADPAGCAATRDAFQAHGVDSDRLILEPHGSPAEALATYNRIDIALDPFPFGGCTTTAETLWMGVPLVTLAGGRWAGRMSQDILRMLGRSEWVAADLDQYTDIACRMADGLPALSQTRAGLRARMQASPFCDAPAFTRTLEAAYRQMWRGWCERG